MSKDLEKSLARFKTAVLEFASASQQSKYTYYRKGERIINEGEIGTDFFLIIEGTVKILKGDGKNIGNEKEIALRHAGDPIGEMTLLQRNKRRTATVEIATDTASFIKLAREDVFSLVRSDSEIRDSLQQLAISRAKETQQVIEGNIHVENKITSCLLTDIHNFTYLGKIVEEEYVNNFLFDFLDSSEEIASHYNGRFEDQGDGFKILLSEGDHANDAVCCAIEIRDLFLNMQSRWKVRSEAFQKIGLGTGICSDFMSIRHKKHKNSSRQLKERVFSHSISIAAAISKYRKDSTDTNIYVTKKTNCLLNKGRFNIDAETEVLLENTNRKYLIYRIESRVKKPSWVFL